MRLLRERLKIYKDSKNQQLISHETIRVIRDEIMDAVTVATAPEVKPHGATIMTAEASMQESNQRQGKPVDTQAARPKTI